MLATVCDGVGELTYKDAAAITSCSFLENCEKPHNLITLCGEVYKANEHVRNVLQQGKPDAGLASTVAGVYIDNKGFTVFNLGDSRVYSFQNGNLDLLSEDHRLIGNQSNKYKNAIVRAVDGRKGRLRVSLHNKAYNPKIELLLFLCTDGIHNSLDKKSIIKILAKKNSLAYRCKELCNEAKQRGSTDDISALLIQV